MQPWFIWNGKNSLADFGIWINKLPPITRGKERTVTIQIPGRPGDLTITEGENVFDSIARKCTILARNDMNLQPILQWLRGSGELTTSNEPDKVYFARIAAEVSFSRISNDLCQAQVIFDCQPFKGHLNPQMDAFTASNNQSIYNPGDVPSLPLCHITGTGADCTATLGGKTMTFNSLSGTIDVDCDARIITQNGLLWDGTFSGEFWQIPTGSGNITISGGTMEIEPRWRWL